MEENRSETPPESTEVAETREKLRAFYEALGSYHSRLLEASSGYNQIVVLGGYAGFFTIWAATSTDLPRWLVLLTGGLIGSSLIVYVGWTVANMIMMRSHMQRMMDEIAKGEEGFLERVQAAETKSIAASNKLMRFWKPVLWTAGLPALAGSALLTGGAFWAVVNDHGRLVWNDETGTNYEKELTPSL